MNTVLPEDITAVSKDNWGKRALWIFNRNTQNKLYLRWEKSDPYVTLPKTGDIETILLAGMMI